MGQSFLISAKAKTAFRQAEKRLRGFEASREKITYTLFIPKSKTRGGCYGEYFKHWSKHGVKVFRDTESEHRLNFKYRLSRKEYRAIVKEAAFINLFFGKKVASLRVAREESKFYMCIVMPHMIGKPLRKELSKVFYNFKRDRVERKPSFRTVPLSSLVQHLATLAGFYLHDVHGDNIIVDYNGRPWVIDFSSPHVQYFGSKAKLENEMRRLEREFKNFLLSS